MYVGTWTNGNESSAVFRNKLHNEKWEKKLPRLRYPETETSKLSILYLMSKMARWIFPFKNLSKWNENQFQRRENVLLGKSSPATFRPNALMYLYLYARGRWPETPKVRVRIISRPLGHCLCTFPSAVCFFLSHVHSRSSPFSNLCLYSYIASHSGKDRNISARPKLKAFPLSPGRGPPVKIYPQNLTRAHTRTEIPVSRRVNDQL